MVSTRPLISKSLQQTFGVCTECANDNWYHHHFHVPFFFSILQQGLGTYLSFRFLSPNLNTTENFKKNLNPEKLNSGQLKLQCSLFSRFTFVDVAVDCHQVWLSCRDQVIHFYLKIPENFPRQILGFAYTICSQVKFNILEKFPVDHLPHPPSRVYSLTLFVLIYGIRLFWSRLIDLFNGI